MGWVYFKNKNATQVTPMHVTWEVSPMAFSRLALWVRAEECSPISLSPNIFSLGYLSIVKAVSRYTLKKLIFITFNKAGWTSAKEEVDFPSLLLLLCFLPFTPVL